MLFKALSKLVNPSTLKNRWIRATELADAARKTGPSGKKLFGIPGMEYSTELGAGEFLRGFLGQKLDKTDAENPKFVENLKEEIKKDVKPENQAVFEKDLEQADKSAPVDQRQEWLDKTANSPAAKAGLSDERRWQTHLKNQKWRKEQGRNYSHGDFF
jgi:hypothetical protein